MNKPKYSIDDIEIVRKLYSEGVEAEKIAETINVSSGTLYKLMKNNGIKSNRNIYTVNYNENTQKEFEDTFLNNIYIPYEDHIDYGNYYHSKYTYDSDYFNSIDVPNKAYILGLLYADGNMRQTKHVATISLQERDKHILEEINTEIKSSKPLTFLKSKKETWQSVYRLDINNRQMCDALCYHGVIPNKSLILEFPLNLPFELYKDFFRGYFDGDGCINIANKSVSFTSTESFCLTSKLFIENYLHINCHIYKANTKNEITKTLHINGKNQGKVFLDWIYKDAKLFLNRKYEKYLELYVNNSLSA